MLRVPPLVSCVAAGSLSTQETSGTWDSYTRLAMTACFIDGTAPDDATKSAGTARAIGGFLPTSPEAGTLSLQDVSGTRMSTSDQGGFTCDTEIPAGAFSVSGIDAPFTDRKMQVAFDFGAPQTTQAIENREIWTMRGQSDNTIAVQFVRGQATVKKKATSQMAIK